MTVSRTGSGPFPVLEDNQGSFADLVTVSTQNKNRKNVIATIRINLENWMKNRHFESIREAELDLAIVACVSTGRMRNQDIDNISKVVLDALKKSEGDDRFLFYDDHQVIRLLVWKIQQEELADYNTDTLYCMRTKIR